MTKKIGLTGSIATGKSTTADLCRQMGLPVFDADGIVHQLYGSGGDAVNAIKAICPEAVINNAVERARLSAILESNPELLPKIEAIIHPLVQEQQEVFFSNAVEAKHPLAIFDIPLLFESGRDKWMDYVIVVTVARQTQRERALMRLDMTDKKLNFILSQQMPDHIKREKADFVIDTGSSIEDSKRQLGRILKKLNFENGF